MAPGEILYVQSGGYYTVTSILDGTHVVLANSGVPGDTSAGTPIIAGSAVMAAGVEGAIGATGATGTTGTTGAQGPIGPGGATGATGATGAPGAPGVTGTTGTTGAAGATGGNAYTVTSAGFTQPNPGSTVPVFVASTAFMAPGEALFIQNGGYYTVSYVNGSTSVVLTNLGVPGNASSGLVIGSGSSVVPSGVQGATGANGANGATGSQGPAGTNGVNGATGGTGATGAQGPTGATGQAGVNGPPTILSGFCGTSTTEGAGTYTSGVLLELGGEDPLNAQCFNMYTPISPAGPGQHTVAGLPMPSAGMLQNLTVVAIAGPTFVSDNIQLSVTVYVNGVANPLLSCPLYTGTSLNCTAAGPVSVGAGDRVAVQVSSSSTIPFDTLSIHASLEKQ